MTNFQDVRAALIDAIETDPSLGVTVLANYGNDLDEVYITAKNPGIEFTATVSTDSSDAYIDSESVRSNFQSPTRKLNNGDLVLNGIAIRKGAKIDDDERSVETSSSSRRDSSAIAIATAINSHSDETGVTAEVVGAKIAGTNTNTGFPGVFPATGDYDLFINGIKVDIRLTQDEPADTRRNNVVNAINLLTHTHGIKATNNSGVTLESTDGRNMSVWFDGSIQGLSLDKFGLDLGGAIAQQSTISLAQSSSGATLSAGDKIAVTINGVQVEAEAVSTSYDDFSEKLKLAIDEKRQMTIRDFFKY